LVPGLFEGGCDRLVVDSEEEEEEEPVGGQGWLDHRVGVDSTL